MKQVSLRNVVCITTDSDLKLPELPDENLSYVYFDKIDDIESFNKHNQLDLIIVDEIILSDDFFPSLNKLSSKYNEIPVAVISENDSLDFFKKAMKSGAFTIFVKPLDLLEFQKKLVSCSFFMAFVKREKKFINKLIISELELQEKNTILETILDMLSHDTKNLFINISNLLKDLPSLSIRSLLKDAFDELYSSMMQAVGYLNDRKRIFSLVDLVSEITLTKQRILLPTYKRVVLKYDSRNILYIESNLLVRNAITNLVENALKYTPEDEMVTVNLKRLGDDVAISVSDRGPGIPDQNKKKIFEKFFRISSASSVEGSGRGLWIAQNIIKKEGGTLEVQDNPGGGADFIITLPAFKVYSPEQGVSLLCEWFEVLSDEVVAKAANAKVILEIEDLAAKIDMDTAVFTYMLNYFRKEKKQKSVNSFRTKLINLKKKNASGKKVLIVDDSFHVHYHLASILTDMGFRVVDYARNGAEGVLFYKKYKPDFVTMDSTMPVLSGSDAAKEIFKFDKNMKIMFITGLGEHKPFLDGVREHLPDSRFCILTKPFSKDQLEDGLKYLKV